MIAPLVQVSKAEPSLHRLADAERDRDDVGDHGRPQAERNRHRHLFQHEVDHADRAEIALPEVEVHVVPDHRQEPFERRLVEPEFALEVGDELGRQPACADVVVGSAAACRDLSPAPGDALEHVAFALDLGQDLFDRPARDELHQGKVDDHDSEQRGNDQQQPSEDVSAHDVGRPAFCRRALCPGASSSGPPKCTASRSACAFSALYHQIESRPCQTAADCPRRGGRTDRNRRSCARPCTIAAPRCAARAAPGRVP